MVLSWKNEDTDEIHKELRMEVIAWNAEDPGLTFSSVITVLEPS